MQGGWRTPCCPETPYQLTSFRASRDSKAEHEGESRKGAKGRRRRREKGARKPRLIATRSAKLGKEGTEPHGKRIATNKVPPKQEHSDIGGASGPQSRVGKQHRDRQAIQEKTKVSKVASRSIPGVRNATPALSSTMGVMSPGQSHATPGRRKLRPRGSSELTRDSQAAGHLLQSRPAAST